MVALCVKVVCDQTLVSRVFLSLSDRFCYQIENSTLQLKKELEEWLKAYSSGVWKPFLKASGYPLFTQKVLDFLPTLQAGSVMTYQEVAKVLGSPKGARAVGNGCRVNPYPLFIPCHRVIGQQGLGGFSAGGDGALEIKRRLLAFEETFNDAARL